MIDASFFIVPSHARAAIPDKPRHLLPIATQGIEDLGPHTCITRKLYSPRSTESVEMCSCKDNITNHPQIAPVLIRGVKEHLQFIQANVDWLFKHNLA